MRPKKPVLRQGNDYRLQTKPMTKDKDLDHEMSVNGFLPKVAQGTNSDHLSIYKLEWKHNS